MTRLLSAAIAAVVMVAARPTALSSSAEPSLPARLESYLTNVVKPTLAERKKLLAGAPITKLLDADPNKEVAVFGAIWIDAPIRRYVEAVQDVESLERGGGFRVTRRVSTPPRLEDFAQLRLSPDDVDDLRTCRVGSCELKLGEQSLHRFQTEIDWNAPNFRHSVDALLQRLAFDYVTGYLDGGNGRLAVYRDKGRPTSVSQELMSMIDQMPELTSYMPDIRRYLLGFPRVSLPSAASFVYWQETDFGLKPTIRISHVTVREGPEDTVVVSKMLYASHYFWTGLELRMLVPDTSRGPGFWFVTVNRSRSDGLSGFTGLFVRRRVRSEVQGGVLAGLQGTKQRLEGTR